MDPDYKRPLTDKALSNNLEYLNKFVGFYDVTLSEELPKQQLQIAVYGKLLGTVFSGGEIGMLHPESYGIFGIKGFSDGRVQNS